MSGRLEELVRRAVHVAFAVDPDECRGLVEDLRHESPGAPEDEIAQRIVDHYARKAALHGFITGFSAHPLVVVPLALLDARGSSRAQAAMVGSLAHLVDEGFFDHPEWEDRVLLLLSGTRFDSSEMQLGKRAVRLAVRTVVFAQGRKLLLRRLRDLASRHALRRRLLARLVPFAGGAIAATWNYVELRVLGERVVSLIIETPLSPSEAADVAAAVAE